MTGHEHARDPQSIRHGAGVKRTGTSKRHQREAPRVISPGHGHSPQGALDVRVGHLDHPQRCFLRCEPHRFAQAAQGGHTGFHVERHLPSEEVPWIHPTQDSVGVCDRYLFPSQAIDDRPGISTRALWPNPQHPACIEPRYGSPSSSDCLHVQHACAQRKLADL